MMRLTLALLAVFGFALASPAAAQTPASQAPISTLAGLMPADTVFFASMRTDPAYLESLEAVLPRLERALDWRADIIRSLDFSPISTIISQSEGWRGTYIAMAVTSPELLLQRRNLFNAQKDVYILVDVADRAAAEAWLLEQNAVAIDSPANPSYTAYTMQGADTDLPLVLLSDSLMLVGAGGIDIAIQTRDLAPLRAADGFRSALDSLSSAGTADFIGYLNVGALLSAAGSSPATAALQAAAADFAGTVAFSGRNVDNQHLVLDVSWRYGNPDALLTYGIDPSRFAAPAVDPAFAARLPVNTERAIYGTDLAGSYQLGLQLIGAGYAIARDLNGAPLIDGLPPTTDIADLLRGTLTVLFASVTGLNLENDVLAALDDGQFALMLNLGQAPDGSEAAFGLVAAHDGSAVTWTQALREALDLLAIPTDTTLIEDANALDLSGALRTLASLDRSLSTLDDLPSLNITINSDMLTLGSSTLASGVFSPEPRSTPAGFDLMLDGAQLFALIDGAAVASAMPNAEVYFSALTASALATPEGILSRFTLSLDVVR
jgi:hypothetical protein